MKHLKHLFTALLLLCTTMATAHDFNVSGIYYNITDATNKTVEVTYRGRSHNEYSNEYIGSGVIPESVTYNGTTYSVTSIGSYAFRDCTELTSVEIPNSVTSIGNNAFSGTAWYNKQPDGVVYAGKVLYRYKGTMPENTSITIKDGTLGIADYAFSGCTGLTSITIPNSVTSIKGSTFEYCTGLTSVTIGNSVTSIGYYAFRGCTGLKSITIPNSVTSIGGDAFSGCSGLTSITIPNSVTSIGSYAFDGCSGLTSVTIGNSVTSIGNYAFSGTAWYNNQPDGVVYAGNVLYEYKGTMPENTSITIKDGTLGIASRAFSGCTGLTSITIPNSVTSIGYSAFSNCTGLTSVVIPNSVTSIGDCAFSDCTGLTSITIPNNVTSIGMYAFYGCYGLKSITIPNSVTSIGYYAFKGCTGLTSIVIPNSVTRIGEEAFYNCTGLTSVVIGNSVTNIGYYAFYDCTGLKSVINFSNLTFSKGSSNDGYVAYYADKVYNLPNDSKEGDFIFGKPNDVNILLYYLGNDAELTLPADYKGENYVIGTDVFKGNTTITSVEIPSSVTSIGHNAFSGCTGLKTVYNFSNLTFSKGSSYNGYVAYYATKVINAPNAVIDGDYIWCKLNGANTLACYLGEVTELTLPADYNGENYVIGNDAFNGCTGLASVVIPSNVTSIGEDAFTGCTDLKTVYNFSNLTFSKGSSNNGYIAYYATKVINAPNAVIDGDFIWCKLNGANTLACYLGEVAELTLPADYNGENYVIGNDAFNGCTGLASVVIPSNVTSIGEDAFTGCTGLKTVYNFSNLTFGKGENTNGYVAYYADKVYNLPNGSKEGDFIFGKPNDVNTLLYYLGNDAELTLPADYKGENYVIGTDVFKGNTTITSVEIPSSVTSIGHNAFSGCTGLKTVYNFSNLTFSKGSSNNGYVAYYAGKVYNAPNGFIDGDFIWYENEYGMTLAGYMGNATELAMPTDYNGKSVTSIGDDAFEHCIGLTSITIPNSVTRIGEEAFYGCSGLTSITIPNSVTSIGDDAFDGCTDLNEVHISDLSAWCNISFGSSNANPLYYAKNLYLNDELITELTIPNSVRNIGNYAFYNCIGLTSIEIPNSVTSIGNAAFENCTDLKTVYNFSNLTFSKGSSNNGYVAYYATKVINAPNAVIDGDYIWCNLNGVNTLAYYLGEDEELVLPVDYNGEIYVIGDDAFNGCTGLRSIEIPNIVTSIGDGAFSGCSGLKEVHISDLAAWCDIDFGSADANPLYYAGNLYLNGKLLTDISIPTEVEKVKDYAFYNCNGVTNIDIVDGVKSIGNSAFYGCDDLEILYISNAIESIGDYAFAECNNLFDIMVGSKKAITASENIFSSDAYTNACLHVPTGRKFAYEKATPWDNFYIAEMDFTGIDEVEAEGEWIKDVYYDLSGRVVENPSSGIYIINGKKVIIK